MKIKKTKQFHKKNKHLPPEQILQFLEDFRQLALGKDSPTQLISLRVPQNVLNLFKTQAQQLNIKYQSQIVKLMREWINQHKTR